MKKHFFVVFLAIILFFVLLFSIILIVLTGSKNHNLASTKNGLLEVEVNYSGFATEKDFEKYNCLEFSFDDTPKGYKLVKLNCKIKCLADFSVAYINVNDYKDDDIYFFDGCLDYEPTAPIHKGEVEYDDLYIYVKEQLNENEIKNRLKSVDFEFSGCRVDDEY